MKPRTISMIVLALASGLLLSHSQVGRVHADDRHERGCSEKTLRGSYGFYRTGTTPMGPLVAVGFIFWDGNGNFTATQKTVRDGDTTRPEGTFSGTYEVYEDCTGRSFTNGVEFVRMIIVDDGKEIYQLSLTPGNTIYVVGKKIHTRDDDHDR